MKCLIKPVENDRFVRKITQMDVQKANSPILCIVSNLTPIKSVDTVIKAHSLLVKTHPKAQLLIIGQGTTGLEMINDFPEVDTVIIPTSGGGLIGGISLALKLQKPSIKVIGVSMERGPSMFESL